MRPLSLKAIGLILVILITLYLLMNVSKLFESEVVVHITVKPPISATTTMLLDVDATFEAEKQIQRLERIQAVCHELRSIEESNKKLFKAQIEERLTTVDLKHYLVDDNTKTAYCFNHKAASSNWISAFIDLYPDKRFTAELRKTGKLYKIARKMNPSSEKELKRKVKDQDYFAFTVVRHPFDRLLSAYRYGLVLGIFNKKMNQIESQNPFLLSLPGAGLGLDRILNGCTGQAKKFIPKIFHTLGIKEKIVKDDNGCVLTSPTFAQFLEYIAKTPHWKYDIHWVTYYDACNPCAIDFKAVVKLETMKDDQSFVLSQTRIGQYAGSSLKRDAHVTSGGKSENYREQFYSAIPCTLLEEVYNIYKNDFMLFEYSTEPFTDYCQKE